MTQSLSSCVPFFVFPSPPWCLPFYLLSAIRVSDDNTGRKCCHGNTIRHILLAHCSLGSCGGALASLFSLHQGPLWRNWGICLYFIHLWMPRNSQKQASLPVKCAWQKPVFIIPWPFQLSVLSILSNFSMKEMLKKTFHQGHLLTPGYSLEEGWDGLGCGGIVPFPSHASLSSLLF